jgi:purine-nucleoside/S-methyl-5'-thioadenosine phosphorylase / adenosine deaminase
MTHAESLTSDLLTGGGFRHAFFTRRGGVSSGPFESLSFSVTVGDDPDKVRENRVRAGRALGVDPERIFFLSQVHGRAVVTLDGEKPREEVVSMEGDALVSGRPDLACAVRSADCVPILIADRRGGAVAAVHAGWRGCVAGVAASAVEALRRHAGAPTDLVAAIGPHISLEAFEVSEEVALKLQAVADVPVLDRSFGARPHVDLRGLVRSQLRKAGLGDGAIDDVFGCTLREPERFFSFRRDGARSGRHLSAIVARG